MEEWIERGEREPEDAGYYRCIRAGIGRRPSYEDICGWDPQNRYWTNKQGTVISSVRKWKEGKVEP